MTREEILYIHRYARLTKPVFVATGHPKLAQTATEIMAICVRIVGQITNDDVGGNAE